MDITKIMVIQCLKEDLSISLREEGSLEMVILDISNNYRSKQEQQCHQYQVIWCSYS